MSATQRARLLLLVSLLILPIDVSAQQTDRYRPRTGTEILWDRYGVPHIFARDSRSLFYAFGWAQMQSHGDLVLRLYGQARGRAAEYWGPDYLEGDRWVWLNGVPARAERNFALTRAPYQSYLQAFVAGANAYAERFPERLDSSMLRVLPIRASDVMAHMQRVLHLGFVLGPAGINPAVRGWNEASGSNAWAVGPSRSASGRTLLLANPHLPWDDMFTWYEAQMASGDVNAYGAALVGFPLLAIAFNDRLGWTHTVNTIDAADLFELTLEGDGYRWDGGVRRFETERVALRVRRGGELGTDTLVIMRSVHGPVIARRGGKALALRVAGLDQPHLLEQNWRMLRARSQNDFESALAMLQLPMFTVMYADRAGHIMHVFNGRVPVRPTGGWAEWGRPVRGDTSATLWTRTHSYRELPRIVDPPTGWLQNANDPPWTTTFPLQLDPSAYPDYMAPQTPLAFRPQRSVRMLMADTSITFEELVEYKHSTRLEAADHVLGPLLAATGRHGTERARRAARVLETWDRAADASSRGTLLFQQFMAEAARVRWPGGTMFAVRWNPARPLTTPDGLSDAEEAASVLDRAARIVEETHGSLSAPYGGAYRLRRDGVDLPANGASGSLGAFRVVDFDAQGRQFIATGGDSFVAAVEFTRPVKAQTLLSYGNASQPGSAHRVDQLPLFARKELKPVWLRREEIMRHLEQRIRF